MKFEASLIMSENIKNMISKKSMIKIGKKFNQKYVSI